VRSRKSRENVMAMVSSSKDTSINCLDRDRTSDAKKASFYVDQSSVDGQMLEFHAAGQVSSSYVSISFIIA